MRNIIIHTLVAVLLVSSLIAFCLLFTTGGAAIFILLMLLFCAPFPTYIAVLLYHFFKRKILPDKRVFSVILSTLLLLFIYHICLLPFVVMESGTKGAISINTMIHEYADEFALVTIIAILQIICIPIAEIVIEKVKRDMKELL